MGMAGEFGGAPRVSGAVVPSSGFFLQALSGRQDRTHHERPGSRRRDWSVTVMGALGGPIFGLCGGVPSSVLTVTILAST